MSDIEFGDETTELLKLVVRKAIIKKGSPVREDGGSFYGGWVDRDVVFERQARAIALSKVAVSDPLEDVDWQEFMGTFDDARTKYGVQVTVTLNKRKKQTWRFEGRMGDLITEILR